MAKKIKTKIKLQIAAGAATPAPPVGPALGQAGISSAEFCQKFNEKTQDQRGNQVGVVITVFEDRTYDFIVKTSPASFLILKAAGLEKGSGRPKEKVGKITKAQAEEIAKIKMPDLNANDLAGAVKIIEGTCKNMGIEVK